MNMINYFSVVPITMKSMMKIAGRTYAYIIIVIITVVLVLGTVLYFNVADVPRKKWCHAIKMTHSTPVCDTAFQPMKTRDF